MEKEEIYRFGSFTIDLCRRRLIRKGSQIRLQPRAFDVLVALVTQPGAVVTREELMDRIWADAFVEEANLTQQVTNLRKALGDVKSPTGWQYIETVYRTGYIFVPKVGRSQNRSTRRPAEDLYRNEKAAADHSVISPLSLAVQKRGPGQNGDAIRLEEVTSQEDNQRSGIIGIQIGGRRFAEPSGDCHESLGSADVGRLVSPSRNISFTLAQSSDVLATIAKALGEGAQVYLIRKASSGPEILGEVGGGLRNPTSD